MDNTGYISLSRQSGLMKEMTSIAHNIANATTTGYRRQGAVFSEFVRGLGDTPSVSMGRLGGHYLDATQGALVQTGAAFDVAIEGEGYFLVETPGGQRLSRAGSMQLDDEGVLITSTGFPVLDNAGGQISLPLTGEIPSIAQDGTISIADQPVGKIGVVVPDGPLIIRTGETLFTPPNGYAPVEAPTIRQGFIEGSNVEPVTEMARMIEVQRTYEFGQTLLEREDERVRQIIREVGLNR